jgi:Flp pilus assembly pilin Flp
VILGVITLAIVTALGVFSTAISSAISTVAGRL